MDLAPLRAVLPGGWRFVSWHRAGRRRAPWLAVTRLLVTRLLVTLPALLLLGGGWLVATAPTAVGQTTSGQTTSSQTNLRQTSTADAVVGHQTAVATAVEITGDTRRTRVALSVDRPIVARISTLGDPIRAIIDIPDLEFRLPATAGRSGYGLVAGFRSGQFEAGVSRIVLDITSPVLIENAAFSPPAGTASGRLTFDLVQISAAAFAATAQASRSPPAASPAIQNARTAAIAALRPSQLEPVPEAPPAGPKSRFVIVIDPGHGGLDPGTVADTSLAEKTVVLAVATRLAALLRQNRQFDVHSTRRDDVFVSLDRRLEISRTRQADLFISIHADSLSEKERDFAQAVHGATIYILSERASDEAARQLADKENSADVLAGLEAVPASDEDQVRNILFDLVRRETVSFAAEFRQQLVAALAGKVPMARDPQRSAAFKVLKQAETPAVLIELGYMSNTQDLARLGKPEWQQQVAAAIATAVDGYWLRHTAKAARR